MMTEVEWLGEDLSPEGMLLRLHGGWVKGHVGKSDRKLRLFSCACCRQVERLVKDERVRCALDVVERHVDGVATDDELRVAGDALERAWDERMEEACRNSAGVMPSLTAPDPSLHLIEAAAYATGRTPGSLMTGGWYALAMHAAIQCRLAVMYAASAFGEGQQAATEAELRTHRALLRDCLGNPFRPSPSLAPEVLAWNDGTIQKLAQGMYDDRAFQWLPMLTDALEEAGCGDADILTHCRQTGLHVRGCWVVDALLGKS
jgi:hypothetical protein